jgi:hypothetical protein
MKVLITYTERVTRELVREVEMTKKEYNEYLKMSTFDQEQKYSLCAECSDEHFTNLEIVSIDADIIKK